MQDPWNDGFSRSRLNDRESESTALDLSHVERVGGSGQAPDPQDPDYNWVPIGVAVRRLLARMFVEQEGGPHG